MNINTKTYQTAPTNCISRCYAFIMLAWVITTCSLLSMVNTAQADTSQEVTTLYRTSFEQPKFMPGDLLSGTDGWLTVVNPPFLNPNAAVITGGAAKSGSQSVEVLGANLTSAAQVFPYDAVGVYRKPLLDQNGEPNGHTISGDMKWVRIDADLMLKTPKPKTPGQFFSLTLSARAGDGSLGEIGLSSQGVVEAFAYDAAPGAAPLTNCSRGIRFNKWHHITLLHDFTRHITSYFIDEHFLCSALASRTSTVLLRGAMGVFARPDGGSAGGVGSVRSDYTARFDNFRVSVSQYAPDID